MVFITLGNLCCDCVPFPNETCARRHKRGHIFLIPRVVVCLRKCIRQHGWTCSQLPRCSRCANKSKFHVSMIMKVTRIRTRHSLSCISCRPQRCKCFFSAENRNCFRSHGTILHSSCGSADDSLASTARRGIVPCSRETQCGNQVGDGAVATCPEKETRWQRAFTASEAARL